MHIGATCIKPVAAPCSGHWSQTNKKQITRSILSFWESQAPTAATAGDTSPGSTAAHPGPRYGTNTGPVPPSPRWPQPRRRRRPGRVTAAPLREDSRAGRRTKHGGAWQVPGAEGELSAGGSAGPGPTWLSAAPSPLSWQRGPAAQEIGRAHV